MLIAIVILAVVLLVLLLRRRRPAMRDDGPGYVGGNVADIDDPNGGADWPGVIDPAPPDNASDDVTPGGGDFGGGGSSGSWGDSSNDGDDNNGADD